MNRKRRALRSRPTERARPEKRSSSGGADGRTIYGKLLLDALRAEAECAAYREALKNVIRSRPAERVGIAEQALNLENPKMRGMMMLKVVKAAVILGEHMRRGDEKRILASQKDLVRALGNFQMVGATARKWLRESAG